MSGDGRIHWNQILKGKRKFFQDLMISYCHNGIRNEARKETTSNDSYVYVLRTIKS